MSETLVSAPDKRTHTATFSLAYPNFALEIVAIHEGQVLQKGPP
jgi:hypothetical protein